MDRATEVKLILEAGNEMRRRGVPITPARVENFVQTRAAQEGYVAGQVAAVERELAKPGNERLGASVNTETGDVAVCVAPTPVGGGPDDAPARGASLSPARRRTLELERDANLLIADDDMSSAGARRMAAARAAAIAKLLALPNQPA